METFPSGRSLWIVVEKPWVRTICCFDERSTVSGESCSAAEQSVDTVRQAAKNPAQEMNRLIPAPESALHLPWLRRCPVYGSQQPVIKMIMAADKRRSLGPSNRARISQFIPSAAR
jgi:hypothetical protein